MSDYSQNMRDERRPPTILPEGHRLVQVLSMVPEVSKSGNNMFVTELQDLTTKKTMTVWLVSEPKKRWLLKTLLTAVGIPAGQDGMYDWDIKDVVGKSAMAEVEHFTQPWVNRDGDTIQQEKAKIIEFYPMGKDATGQPTAWEE